ncbi:hypothetical protein EFS38_16690 [Dickeya undicola]|uniref:Uncharacterized protein n=1 Tax=Dickeya undicola TaxID=1577887 RepID=A0ABX9WRB7_9GAMM|nr:hypothetical protein EFS38_16690 [Dickeya undicola]
MSFYLSHRFSKPLRTATHFFIQSRFLSLPDTNCWRYTFPQHDIFRWRYIFSSALHCEPYSAISANIDVPTGYDLFTFIECLSKASVEP